MLFTKRETEQYMCRTLRSIMNRAQYTSLYLSFSGESNAELKSLREMCPEIRAVPTAVHSPQQAKVMSDEITYLRPFMRTVLIDNMETEDGDMVTMKMNSIDKNIPQWYTMKNAINMPPPDSGRHLIVMEDDVVLAEDFDALLRASIVEAEAQGDVFALSMYIGNSQSMQVTEDGAVKPLVHESGHLAVDQRWEDVMYDVEGDDKKEFWKVGWRASRKERRARRNLRTRKERIRGSSPMLVNEYVWGQQAVMYSAGILPSMRAFFDSCERETSAFLKRAKRRDVDEERRQKKKICIKPIDVFNADFMNSFEMHVPFYTTKDSLVQHIGISSTIQNIDGVANQKFHQNVELGTVSENYDDQAALMIHERPGAR